MCLFLYCLISLQIMHNWQIMHNLQRNHIYKKITLIIHNFVYCFSSISLGYKWCHWAHLSRNIHFIESFFLGHLYYFFCHCTQSDYVLYHLVLKEKSDQANLKGKRDFSTVASRLRNGLPVPIKKTVLSENGLKTRLFSNL